MSPELCRRLREARRTQGLTQAVLAQRVGCQQSAICMMESGHGTALARETLARIAAELGVTVETTPATDAAVSAPGRWYCPDPACPSNVPFAVNGEIVFWPRPQPEAGGMHCAYCGEVLARACAHCQSPAGTGACCRVCGQPYVPPPAGMGTDVEAWAAARRQHLAEWRALLG